MDRIAFALAMIGGIGLIAIGHHFDMALDGFLGAFAFAHFGIRLSRG